MSTRAARHPQRWSLRARLYLIALLSTLSAWVAGGTAMYWSAQQQNDVLYDARLADLAQTILTFSQHEIAEMAGDMAATGLVSNVHEESRATLGSRYQYQIWSRDGRLLLRSYNASATRPIATLGTVGPSVVGRGEEGLHAYVIKGVHDMEIHVGELQVQRQSVTGTLSAAFAGLFVLSMAVAALLSGWMLHGALAPLRVVSADLRVRDENDLSPLRVSDVPLEMAPMVTAVNHLFDRIDRAFHHERGFTAVAAHEMRTPLASLRMQAQVALRCQDSSERTEALQHLMHHVDRCAHLLDQLLTLARLDDAASVSARIRPVRLAEVAAEALADVSADAERRDIDISTRLAAPEVSADPVGLQTLLRNLIANAVRYSPEGGQVRIETRREGSEVVLRVDDSGPGIDPADRERVFDRFQRLRQDRSGGAGLGLSIVQAVVKAHGATIALGDAALGGLRVEVRWPQPA